MANPESNKDVSQGHEAKELDDLQNFIENSLKQHQDILIFGESHSPLFTDLAPATEPVAQALKKILQAKADTNNSPKKFALFVEGLIKKPQDKKYQIDELINHVKKADLEYLSTNLPIYKELMEMGVEIYGTENEVTAPHLFFDKLTDRQLIEILTKAGKPFDKVNELSRFDLEVLAGDTITRQQRLPNANREWTNTISKYTYDHKNTTCILICGAEHLFPILKNDATKELVEPGMCWRMSEALAGVKRGTANAVIVNDRYKKLTLDATTIDDDNSKIFIGQPRTIIASRLNIPTSTTTINAALEAHSPKTKEQIPSNPSPPPTQPKAIENTQATPEENQKVITNP
jgi:hypothetical protein